MDTNESENSEWFKNGVIMRIIAIYIVVFADVILNTFLEPPPGSSKSNAASVVTLFCLEILCVFSNMALFYSVFTKTWYFQAGLFGTVLKRFRAFLVAFVVYIILLITVRFYRLYAVIQEETLVDIWQMPAYLPLYFLNKIASVSYYVSVVQTTFSLCEYQLYNASEQDIRFALQGGNK